MDVVESELARNKNFKLVNRVCGDRIVVHCVPGAGKSTIIRRIISGDTRFRAYTLGVADPASLSGQTIRPYCELAERKDNFKFTIIDEYILIKGEIPTACALFGDNLQYRGEHQLIANYICTFSYRVGKATCELLRNLHFDIQSEKEDICEVHKFTEFEPVGKLIAIGQEALTLLKRHKATFFTVEQVRGAEFDTVTLLLSEEDISDFREEFYLCATRHTRELHILTPDATITASR
ncbi:triple gene block protein 1 [Clivia carlavirus A]|uniref:Triple gene block protein 1 n=1 Tax=Clivia carlavirus A TaxID=2838077 RepID=A0A8E7NFY3_9VIRU|nr:triple gene block protein 1 [Clivia carlavirus A]QVY19179.1 triple gene block protein 1 [Clivia carlavirus A]